jgi:hypothetical protein
MMKKLLLFLTILMIAQLLVAQAPEGFNYQAVMRDAQGQIIANQAVGIQLSIAPGAPPTAAVYQETHTATTNDYGLVTLPVGQGTAVSGTFSSINWASGTYFMEVAIDESGGSNYTSLGAFQLLSVPFAMYAKNAENVDDADSDPTNEIETWTTLAGIPAGFADGVDNVDDADNDPTNEVETWTTLAGIPAGFADGIDNVDDADNNPANEIQSLSISGDQLSISGGNQVTLPSSSGTSLWSQNANAIYYDQGPVGVGIVVRIRVVYHFYALKLCISPY